MLCPAPATGTEPATILPERPGPQRIPKDFSLAIHDTNGGRDRRIEYTRRFANLHYLPDTMESASNPIRKPPSDTDCRKKPNRKNVRNIEKNIRETAGSPDDDTRPEEFLRPFCHIRLPPFPDTEAGRTSPRPLGRMLRHSPNRDASKLSSSSKSGASNSERPPSMNRR